VEWLQWNVLEKTNGHITSSHAGSFAVARVMSAYQWTRLFWGSFTSKPLAIGQCHIVGMRLAVTPVCIPASTTYDKLINFHDRWRRAMRRGLGQVIWVSLAVHTSVVAAVSSKTSIFCFQTQKIFKSTHFQTLFNIPNKCHADRCLHRGFYEPATRGTLSLRTNPSPGGVPYPLRVLDAHLIQCAHGPPKSLCQTTSRSTLAFSQCTQTLQTDDRCQTEIR